MSIIDKRYLCIPCARERTPERQHWLIAPKSAGPRVCYECGQEKELYTYDHRLTIPMEKYRG